MTPTEWREGGHRTYSKNIIEESEKTKQSNATFDHLKATIVKMPQIEAYYIRHNGYNDHVRETWQKIQSWTYSNNIENYQQIALFHDNPAITHLDECHYVACVQVNDSHISGSERLPKFKIFGGTYAKFDIKGSDGDLLKFMYWLYSEWLPNSEYETTTKPQYVVYQKNKYLSDDNNFELSFYLSIKF